MNFTPISALSPLDGRYASKLQALRPLMSEQGYMHRRVQVEIAWFIALSDAGFDQFKPLSPGARTYLTGLVKNFSEADAEAIKAFEKITNHDVKAVEYWIKSKFKDRPDLEKATLAAPAKTSTTPAMRCNSKALALKSSCRDWTG
jgi:adenylosuccinate lyase